MMTREQWLLKLAKRMEVLLFKPAGATLPAYRVTCGWPSGRALLRKNRSTGQCFDASCSGDKTTELIVSMYIDDPMKAAGILAHEMVHAVVGNEAGHGAIFKQVALAIGLEGKMISTVAGECFIILIDVVLGKLGPYPHASVDFDKMAKKQTTRMIKVVCSCSEYTVRMSRKWINDAGCPGCAVCGETMAEAV